MDIFQIIEHFYKKDSKAYEVLITHSSLVAEKALHIAERFNLADKNFIYEAALIHDIGMIKTNAPDLGCFGKHPYICHGILGKEMLRSIGLNKHGLVCSRHTGTGISKEEIIKKKLPLPEKDFLPISIEEEIICYSDKFFSKDPLRIKKEKTYEQVIKEMARFGKVHSEKIKNWHEQFEG